MERKRLFFQLGAIIVSIFAINTMALFFHWYYTMWYFDMITHFLGGFWLGLLFIWAFTFKNSIYRDNELFYLSVFVAIAGISWEVFEFLVRNVWAAYPFDIKDTISDIFFDLAGGVFAVFYFMKIFISTKSTV